MRYSVGVGEVDWRWAVRMGRREEMYFRVFNRWK